MCWTFFFFWCSCIQPVLMLTTSWDLVTSPVVFGKEVELRCTVVGNASCCSKYTRIWSKGSKTILINGNPSLPSKYNETIDAANKQFSLIIYHLSKEDVDAVYTCAYGNISPQKTLTQNDSFEYHPTESKCPVEIHNGELVGTLIVNMSAPYPSVTAQYGDRNFTSYLTTNITPVAGSKKFYTINSYLKRHATCGNDEKFTLSVLTGAITTNICDNVDFCTCSWCALWSFLCSWISAVFTQTIYYFIVKKQYEGKAKQGSLNVPFLEQKDEMKKESLDIKRQVGLMLLILVIALMNTLVPALVGYFVCTCLSSSHWFWIICGVGTSLSTTVLAKILVQDLQGQFQCTLLLVQTGVGLVVFILYLNCKNPEEQQKEPGREEQQKEPGREEQQKEPGRDPPTVHVKMPSYSVTTGNSVTLNCTVTSALPITNVCWEIYIGGTTTTITSNTNTKKYSGSTTTTPSLTILDAYKIDAGQYICFATNSVGTVQSSPTNLSVTGIVDPPTVHVKMPSYSVTTGNSVTLNCTVTSALPITNVYWERYIGGTTTTITSNTNTKKYIGSTTTTPSLTILDADQIDAGQYTCFATNSVGPVQSSPTNLSVTGSPPTVQILLHYSSIITGNSVTLMCTVTSALPILDVHWERNSGGTKTTITSTTNKNKYRGSTTTNPSLTILNVDQIDAGQYTCFATNSVGPVQSSPTTLSVTGTGSELDHGKPYQPVHQDSPDLPQ